ncbi:OPT family oligopeptide transporter [Bythopirellula polymerisocia]|uniref:OPT oligopeptide transporter protein n=1 Tax=Bythopirellula polymerisocia TaxID=2528003 RepID=A0A5C6D297_9BACT|nr:OPT family oligopeptide transporter [Bythopirellula polymerisocia]TWU30255.1 OPT oligopeptide transporter protein [Bythopirellula polymerisocia]
MSEPHDTPRQLTIRAAATGAVLGALLVPCNVYSGLKIGWSFNMSIAAALLSCGFWGIARRGLGERRVVPWGLLENNVNQTCASSAASIISAGLVAPIPALTILTGQTLSWPVMAIWLFTVSCIGVLVGLALRKQMLIIQELPFPSGIATAETVREIYAEGREATSRVRYLLGGGLLSASTKLFADFIYQLPQVGPAMGLGALRLPTITTRSLGFVLDPSFLMIGFGAIVGLKVGLSLLLGAGVAWGFLAPWLFATGRVPLPIDGQTVYGTAVEFLLWPGVAMMVTSALVSFSFTLPGVFRSVLGSQASSTNVDECELNSGVSKRLLAIGFVLATLATTIAQVSIFGIEPHMGLLAVMLTFVLAVVAARVSGETGIPPIGALGKVTQLTFGFVNPTNVTENLMTANVTGGAAGQCSDLLHDLKAGLLLGASVRAQAAAQFLGVLVGSLAGSAAYLVLIPDPATMLLTKEWPAPAVATWKAVAELFRDGIDAAPSGALTASIIGAIVGAALAIVQKLLPDKRADWCPSAVSLGLAFVIPAFNSISLCLGAALAAIATRLAPEWSRRFVLPIAAGLVAGESLAGVASALTTLLFSS